MYHLAIDIGASSGRHILGSLVDGKLHLEEIYRFENNLKEENGTLIWDVKSLVNEVISGIKKCKELGKTPKTVAIDTWGVDYVLLDENKKGILPCISYRDSRTDNAEKEVSKILPQSKLYSLTGIQKMNFNTIYQLYCDKKSGKLEKARYCLLMPSYLSFKLCGKLKNEYTNATTTNLVNAYRKDWDDEILSVLGINKDLLCDIVLPATYLGDFTEEIQNVVGFNAKVISAPSHDTASAVAACPIDDNSVYISSGTWSLLGTENQNPVLSAEALNANFTNEGGIEYRFRFLKNIIGMWFFQCIRRDLQKKLSYDEMMKMAMKSDFSECFDPTDNSFLAPKNMIEAVRNYLQKPNLPTADVLKSVYLSLAKSYDRTIKEIEKISNKKISEIHIVGGGSRDSYLNYLTQEITGKKVFTGLSEATATGNILSQIMYSQNISLEDARKTVKKSFDIKEASI